jgi:hypothetical protein
MRHSPVCRDYRQVRQKNNAVEKAQIKREVALANRESGSASAVLTAQF